MHLDKNKPAMELFLSSVQRHHRAKSLAMPKPFVVPILLLVWIGSIQLAGAQKPRGNAPSVLLFGIGYGANWPLQDLAQRFGPFNGVSGNLEYLQASSNLMVGLHGVLFFGSQVAENPLAGLTTVEGLIIGNDRNPADIQLRSRAYALGTYLGKLWPLAGQNRRAGLRTTLGMSFLQHKIRIQDDPARVVPQLTEDYKKGYDRLTNGLALRLGLGYQHLSTDRRINYLLELEWLQGFTENRRSFDFATRQQLTGSRQDGMLGVRAVWFLPFYRDDAAALEY